jgi:hypothetical protein
MDTLESGTLLAYTPSTAAKDVADDLRRLNSHTRKSMQLQLECRHRNETLADEMYEKVTVPALLRRSFLPWKVAILHNRENKRLLAAKREFQLRRQLRDCELEVLRLQHRVVMHIEYYNEAQKRADLLEQALERQMRLNDETIRRAQASLHGAVESVKKQADGASDGLAEIADLQMQLGAAQELIRGLKADLREKEDLIESLRESSAHLTETVAELEARNATIATAEANRLEDIRKLKCESASLHDQVKVFSEKEAKERERATVLEGKVETLEKELARAKLEVEKALQSESAVRNEKDQLASQLHAEIASLQATGEKTAQALQQSKSELAEAENKLKQNSSSPQTDKKEAEAAISTLKKERNELRQGIAAAQKEARQSKTELEKKEKSLKEKDKKIGELEKLIKTTQASAQSSEAKLNKTLAQKDSELERLKKELEKDRESSQGRGKQVKFQQAQALQDAAREKSVNQCESTESRARWLLAHLQIEEWTSIILEFFKLHGAQAFLLLQFHRGLVQQDSEAVRCSAPVDPLFLSGQLVHPLEADLATAEKQRGLGGNLVQGGKVVALRGIPQTKTEDGENDDDYFSLADEASDFGSDVSELLEGEDFECSGSEASVDDFDPSSEYFAFGSDPTFDSPRKGGAGSGAEKMMSAGLTNYLSFDSVDQWLAEAPKCSVCWSLSPRRAANLPDRLEIRIARPRIVSRQF